MNNFFSFLFKHTPQLLISLILVIAQLVFINSNIIGVYMFGSFYTGMDRYKIFIISVFITLLFDAIKIIPLGTWALAFFAVTVLIEGILQIFGLKNELQSSSLRGNIFLIVVISLSTIAHSYALQFLSFQTLAKGGEWSIFVLAILFVLLHRITATRSSREYIQL